MSALRIVRPPSTRGGRAYSPRCGPSPNYLGRLLVFCFFFAVSKRRSAAPACIGDDNESQWIKESCSCSRFVSFVTRSAHASRTVQSMLSTSSLLAYWRSPGPLPFSRSIPAAIQRRWPAVPPVDFIDIIGSRSAFVWDFLNYLFPADKVIGEWRLLFLAAVLWHSSARNSWSPEYTEGEVTSQNLWHDTI